MQRPILIIDDSENISIRMQEFFTKLGYKEIHLSKHADEGVKKFQELGKDGSHPIVFLDYEIDDGSGMSLLSRLLSLDTDGEIIVMSSLSKESEIIMKLINEGAYEVIQKPIRLDTIKNIMSIIELENSENNNSTNVDELLKTTNRLSEIWLSQNSMLSDSDLQACISKWISEKKIQPIDDIEEICCPVCDSIKTGHIFYCPECKKSDFFQSDLIEHFDCGCVDLEKNYVTDRCPSCRKYLKALGVDHRRLKNFYTCNKCDNRFQEIGRDFICLKCNNRFAEDEAVWKSSKGFQVTSSK